MQGREPTAGVSLVSFKDTLHEKDCCQQLQC